ncbi:MAG: glycosyltransferase [Coriobacteriales bacterium]|nr:glycosyltransferase [Coriobacteriales bacterium]
MFTFLNLFNLRDKDVHWLRNFEMRKGAAVRAAGCTPLGDGRFLLDIRCDIVARRVGRFQLRVTRADTGEQLDFYEDGEAAIDLPYANKHRRGWVERRYRVVLCDGTYDLCMELVRKKSGEVALSYMVERDYWRLGLPGAYYELIRNPFADEAYEAWRLEHCVSEEACELQRTSFDASAPLISLVSPLYCTPPEFLRAMLDSVLAQTYANWELVLVNASPDDEGIREVLADYDDPRIRLFDHPENNGINGNTNFGISHCLGSYIGFIDHDDFIEPDLLFEYASAIVANPKLDLLYCNEDTYREGKGYTLPLFKPEFCPDLLYSNNYVIHLLMVSRRVLDAIELSPDETNGAQDYDLTLKACEQSHEICRVPRMLYHWRAHELSTNAGNKDVKPYANVAGQTALNTHFARRGIACEVQLTDVPYVYKSVADTRYSARDVSVVVSDDSQERNEEVRKASTPFVLLCASELHVPTSEQIETLLTYFARDEVGMVAPRLVYKELLVRYGIVIARDGSLVRLGEGLPVGDPGYVGRFVRPANYSMLDHACVLMRRDLFLELGGYRGTYQTLDYEQADLCLRCREKDLFLVLTPFVECEYKAPLMQTMLPCSHTAQTLIVEDDRRAFAERWDELVRKGDPFFDPNLDAYNPYYRLG